MRHVRRVSGGVQVIPKRGSCTGSARADLTLVMGPDQFIKKGEMDLDTGNPRDEMLYTAIHTMTTVTQARFVVIQRAHLKMILRRNT